MLKKKGFRAIAVGMAAMVGLTGSVGSQYFLDNRASAEKFATKIQENIVFAEGEGLENPFSSASWEFYASAKDGEQVKSAYYPAIVNDGKEEQYLGTADNEVIRLIRGVKEGSKSGIEADDSYSAYRSGSAFLKEGFDFNSKAIFSVAFTFSMPEAVVNQGQTGGAEFSREVGGDGIAFLMTTNGNQKVQAGSGIGYQGLEDSLAIEMDSYFNGAYCDMKAGTFAYTNWGFDNQLYFHKGSTPDGTNNYGANPYDSGYENYVNYNNEERFDHIGINLDGNVKKHEAVYYINQLDPTQLSDGKYVNLRNRYYHTAADTTSANASTESTCATRFADKGVDNRLFTVWVDYDGKKMDVYYANGKLSTAVKPATPQISQKVDMTKFEGKKVYMGFTSAIGSSKANHTIHSFKVSVPEEVPTEAGYGIRYWVKDTTTDEYVLKDASDIFAAPVGSVKTAEDIDGVYATKYEKEGYVYSNTAAQKTSVTLEEAEQIYYMDVYYDPADPKEAYYKVNYHVWNTDSQTYEKKESSEVFTGEVGEVHTVGEVNPNYGTKYPNYAVNTEKTQEYKVTLSEAGVTYEMNVFYDPEQAGYKLNYYKLNPKTNKYEYVESTKTLQGNLGQTYTVTDCDTNYEDKYTKDGYVINKAKNETYSVVVEKEDVIYEMDVYYDPVLTTYKTEYYLKQPDGSYKLKDTVPGDKVYAGTEVTAPAKSYDGYVHVTTENTLEQATIAPDGSTTMKVYYDPNPVYAVEYYVEQKDGSYKLYTETREIQAIAGDAVTAPIISIPGYKHTTTEFTKESGVVLPDSSTVLKVYYDLEDKGATGTTSAPIEIVDTPTPTPVITPAPVTTPAITAKPVVPDNIQAVEVTATPTVEPSEEPTAKPIVKASAKPKVKPTVKPTKKPQQPVVTQPETPDTGDHTTNVFALILLMIASLGVAVDAALRARKKK